MIEPEGRIDILDQEERVILRHAACVLDRLEQALPSMVLYDSWDQAYFSFKDAAEVFRLMAG